MEIGISTASYFSKLQIEDAALDLGAHGVKLCEVFLDSFCEYETEFVQMLSERLQSGGVEVFSVHPMSMQFEPQLFSVHPRQRADAWRLFEQVLADGRILGASHYTMHGPANLSGAVKNIAMERISPIFRDLSQMADSYGIVLTLENVSWCLFSEPEFGQRLLDHVGPGRIQFTLDVKQALRAGRSPLAFVDAVGDEIANVHLCDVLHRADGSNQYAMPGFGGFDFAALAEALHAHHYRGPAFIEVYSDMYTEIPTLYESLARMRCVFNSSFLF